MAQGAGLLLERPEDLKLPESMRQSARKKRVRASHITIASGLAALKSTGFLVDFHISKKGIVTVRRAGDSRPIYA